MVYDIGYYLTLLGDQSAKKLSPQSQKSCNQFHKKMEVVYQPLLYYSEVI